VWNWTDSEVGDGKSEIALVPVGLQLEEPVVFFKVDDAAGVRTGCSRGMRLSAVTRDNVRFRSAERRAWRGTRKTSRNETRGWRVTDQGTRNRAGVP